MGAKGARRSMNTKGDRTSLHHKLTVPFDAFAKKHGMFFFVHHLSTFEMSSNVVWNTMPFFGWSTRAFSNLR